jgi:hypothetical protein
MTTRFLLTLSIVLAACSAAHAQPQAQDRRPDTAAPMADPKACAPGERQAMPREGGGATTGAGENLSDKLARTDGVICPPDVDPGIKAPTPDAGKTPVIPPPGSPGGDPSVRPK